MGCSNLSGSDKYPANVSFWGMCGLDAGRPTQPTVGRRTRVIFQKMEDWTDNIHIFFSISIRSILLKWFESVTFSQLQTHIYPTWPLVGVHRAHGSFALSTSYVGFLMQADYELPTRGGF